MERPVGRAYDTSGIGRFRAARPGALALSLSEFFKPSLELTDKLLLVQSAAEMDVHVHGRHVISKLRSRLAPLLDGIESRLSPGGRQSLLLKAQADISERIYHFLVTLGESAAAGGGAPYDLATVFPEGMRERLGIPLNHWSLLVELTDEFRVWAKGDGRAYKPPWGELRLGERDELRVLVADEEVKLEPVEPARAFYLPPRPATPRALTDNDLIHAIARGDEAALAELYERYSNVLINASQLKLLSNRDEAESVMQEVFLDVWRKAGTFDESQARAFSWLRKLTLERASGLIVREFREAVRARFEQMAEEEHVNFVADRAGEPGAEVSFRLARPAEAGARALGAAQGEGGVARLLQAVQADRKFSGRDI